MAWENLPAIESNGVVYNLPLLTDSDIEWVATQSSSGNYKVKSTLDITENNASTPFKYTTNPGDSEILQIHFSNNTNYLQFRGTGNYTLRINYFSNVGGGTLGVTMNVSNRGYYTSNLLYYYGIIINTETQQAKIWCFNQSASNQYQLVSGAYGNNTALFDLYQNVINAIPTLYNWSSVPAISGKNGILSLSQIKDESIGTGDYVAAGEESDFKRLVFASSLDELTANVPNNTEIEVAWAGNTHYMTLERTAPLKTFVIRLYMFGFSGPVYSYTYSPGSNNTSYLSFIRDLGNEVAALSIIGKYTTDNIKYSYNSPGASTSAEDMTTIYNWLLGHVVSDDVPSIDSFVDNEGDGGGVLQDRENIPIPKPDVPYLSAYDSGFVSQYQITKPELKKLCSYLWSNDFWENVGKFFGDPKDIIMGLCIFPLVPPTGSSKTIKAGGITTNATGYPLTEQFHRYPIGRAKIKKRLVDETGNEASEDDGIYFDYSPFTSIKIYIPYCGEHDLSPNDVMGKSLQLDYTVDHLSGMCCAHLTIIDPEGNRPDECHYNFTGQMGVQIPLSLEDYGGFYRSMLSSGAAVGSTIATIATGGMTAPLAVGAAANAMNNISNMAKDVQYTSGGGSISGSLSSNYPYITITEPEVFLAENQGHYTGFPVYATAKLKNLRGFTKIMGIHLDGLKCNEQEREAIRAQLQQGVIFGETNAGLMPARTAPNDEFSIVFLKNLSDVDTIGKTFAVDPLDPEKLDAHEISGKLLFNQDLDEIELVIYGNFFGYNYAYIREFERYYYINKFVAESGNQIRVSFSCDASESFWNELQECKGLIESNENLSIAKLMVNNNTWFMKQKHRVVTETFLASDGSTAKFDRSANGTERYLITIAGDTNDAT